MEWSIHWRGCRGKGKKPTKISAYSCGIAPNLVRDRKNQGAISSRVLSPRSVLYQGDLRPITRLKPLLNCAEPGLSKEPALERRLEQQVADKCGVANLKLAVHAPDECEVVIVRREFEGGGL